MVVTVLESMFGAMKRSVGCVSKLAALLNESQLRGVVFIGCDVIVARHASFIGDEWWHQMSSLVRLHSLLKYVMQSV